MAWLLNDEEIRKLEDEIRTEAVTDREWHKDRLVAKVTKAQARKIMEMGNELCPYDSMKLKRCCLHCWKELEKDIELPKWVVG